MIIIIADIFTYLLAVYGAIALIFAICNSIKQRLCNDNSSIKMVLIVKNQEEVIEGIIRNLSSADILRKAMTTEKLTILDMSSSDKTLEILNKLKSDYEYFDILEEDEKESIFAGFEVEASKDLF